MSTKGGKNVLEQIVYIIRSRGFIVHTKGFIDGVVDEFAVSLNKDVPG
jgi:hypothetical protein